LTELTEQQPRHFGVARSYDDLHAIIRARADELQTTRESIDEVAGLQAGYSGKLLGNSKAKKIGPVSMGPLLAVLGLALAVIEDPESYRVYSMRLEARNASSPVHPPAKQRRRAKKGPEWAKFMNAQHAGAITIQEAANRSRSGEGALAGEDGMSAADASAAADHPDDIAPKRRSEIARQAAKARWHKKASSP
jgi:hypothetical protein